MKIEADVIIKRGLAVNSRLKRGRYLRSVRENANEAEPAPSATFIIAFFYSRVKRENGKVSAKFRKARVFCAFGAACRASGERRSAEVGFAPGGWGAWEMRNAHVGVKNGA